MSAELDDLIVKVLSENTHVAAENTLLIHRLIDKIDDLLDTADVLRDRVAVLERTAVRKGGAA